jgi:hypothetical protein
MNLPRLLSLLLIVLVLPAQAESTVYSWVDAEGKRHFSDQPSNPNAQPLNPRGVRTPAPAAEAAAPVDAAECEKKRAALRSYESAGNIIERDNLGNERAFSEAEREQLLSRARQQVTAACGPAADTEGGETP